MDSVFTFVPTVRPCPFYFKHDALVTNLPFGTFQDVQRKPHAMNMILVHPYKHVNPICRFLSPCAWNNISDIAQKMWIHNNFTCCNTDCAKARIDWTGSDTHKMMSVKLSEILSSAKRHFSYRNSVLNTLYVSCFKLNISVCNSFCRSRSAASSPNAMHIHFSQSWQHSEANFDRH